MPVYQRDTLGQQLFQARMKAHDVLQEHLKQIILIASGTLTLTVSFLGNVIGVEGEKSQCAWMLPISWGFLGTSITLSIVTIAILVNTLDWPGTQKAKPPFQDDSFTAGARYKLNRWVALSIGTFSFGMLSLGAFAVLNYKLFLHQVRTDYTIKSAAEAVAKAREQLPSGIDASLVQVTKAELIKGIYETPPSDQVWHVQLQYESSGEEPLPVETTRHAPSGKRTKHIKSRHRKSHISPQVPKIKKGKTITLDLFLNAKTGEVTKVP